MIDWTGDQTHLLLNPRLPAHERERLERLATSVPPLPGHVWIATSGTSGALRLVSLSKEAIRASAVAVNLHLDSSERDVWACVLPTFHVGGLGIHARAALSGARVVSMPWDPRAFWDAIQRERVTLSALVPAQVRDLVTLRLQAPGSIRAIVIGGAAFPEELYGTACELGWPVLPSYGMTETCSQIATAAVGGGPEMRLLSHAEVRVETDGRLAIRSASLLTGYAWFDGEGRAVFNDPKRDGWFVAEDRGEVEGGVLRVFGRSSDFIKIGGESTDLRRLDTILEGVRGSLDAAVVAVADERLGHVIHLAVTGSEALAVVEAFNAQVLPFERIRRIHRVASIPRSPLGKLLRKRLTDQVRGGGEEISEGVE